MPRVPNTRPTIVYWLIDMRPETLVEHPQGHPFYCGKTVRDIPYRLRKHRTYARRKPNRLVSVWLNQCGEYMRVQVMETVPANGDWIARERWWIYTIRTFWPGGANVSAGGTGVPGYVHSAESRAKMSASMRGKKRSADACARMSASRTGRKLSDEQRAKISTFHKGKKLSAEHCAKMSASNKGKKRSPETCARISASKKGHKISADIRAKMSAAQKGKKRKPFSAEHIANMRAGALRSVAAKKQMQAA